MQMRPEKVQSKTLNKKGIEEEPTGMDDSEGEDIEMEKFANEEMDRQMSRMASGAPGGMPDTDEEDGSVELGGSGEEEGSDAGFFSGEDDLQEVEVSQEDEEEDAAIDDEEGEDLMSEDSYGAELSEEKEATEEEADSDLPEEETTKKQQPKGKKRNRNEFEGKDIKQTKSGTRYASYEDFADLLEEGLDEEVEKPKKK